MTEHAAAKTFVLVTLSEGRASISIEPREGTNGVLSLAARELLSALVSRQSAMFVSGLEAHVPLKLKDVAGECGVDLEAAVEVVRSTSIVFEAEPIDAIRLPRAAGARATPRRARGGVGSLPHRTRRRASDPCALARLLARAVSLEEGPRPQRLNTSVGRVVGSRRR